MEAILTYKESGLMSETKMKKTDPSTMILICISMNAVELHLLLERRHAFSPAL
ncbi:MAG: hypothetical protein H7832_00855 [Magnetococcus sp. DMHC-6]